jgi:hypothetical protein
VENFDFRKSKPCLTVLSKQFANLVAYEATWINSSAPHRNVAVTFSYMASRQIYGKLCQFLGGLPPEMVQYPGGRGSEGSAKAVLWI